MTYLKAFDEIRKTFAATHEAKLRNYGPSQFSFNVEGGRCNACEGNGFLTIDMQFLADVMMRCPECRGTRYRPEMLEVTYRGQNIAEVLELTAREAFGFFRHRPKVQARLRPLLDVGLDYLRLGQPASTLSGGEAQRLKLASYLAPLARRADARPRRRSGRGPSSSSTSRRPACTRPTRRKLLDALDSLLDLGHSLIVVEHSPELMRARRLDHRPRPRRRRRGRPGRRRGDARGRRPRRDPHRPRPRRVPRPGMMIAVARALQRIANLAGPGTCLASRGPELRGMSFACSGVAGTMRRGRATPRRDRIRKGMGTR